MTDKAKLKKLLERQWELEEEDHENAGFGNSYSGQLIAAKIKRNEKAIEKLRTKIDPDTQRDLEHQARRDARLRADRDAERDAERRAEQRAEDYWSGFDRSDYE